MLQFFKRIRKELVSKNKVRKYFFYAIGEIILVVIGILIALAINNSNEQRKLDDSEQKYLIALQEEFNANLEEIERVMALSDSTYLACKRIINKKHENGRELTDFELQKALMNSFRFPPKFNQSPGILNELISSGNLSKLKNEELRSRIQNWLVTIEEVRDEEEEFWMHREKAIDFMQKQFSFRKYMIDIDEQFIGEILSQGSSDINPELYYNDEMDNYILFYTIVLRSLQVGFYPTLQADIEAILAEIDNSIDK